MSLLNTVPRRLSPLLLRGPSQLVYRKLYISSLPDSVFLSRTSFRANSTATSTSGDNNRNFPPPGFNSSQARKPLSNNEPPREPQSNLNESNNPDRYTVYPDNLNNLDAKVVKNEVTLEQKVKTVEAQPSVREVVKNEVKLEQKVKTVEVQPSVSEVVKNEEKNVSESKDTKKVTLWQKVKKEAIHYWEGTKLLALEVRISYKFTMKMMAGYELTRREHRQLQRTIRDLGRMLPFSVLVIVPLGELLLPFLVKFFPNLLPSTYEGQKSKEAKANRLRLTRNEVASFLCQSIKETGLGITAVNVQREEVAEFFRKVRSTDESPMRTEIIKMCKVFKNCLTLDNLSRPQLVGICRFMNLTSFGTDSLLRYNVRHKMRKIKHDDKAISFEGIDALTIPELQSAAASRGLRSHGVSPARLREDLQMWLDLRLKYGVPSTLLILSHAFMYTHDQNKLMSQIDALQAVLQSGESEEDGGVVI